MNVVSSIFGLMFFALNMLGPIVAGIWLGFLGEWSLIGVGVGYMMIGAVGISILMMPGLLLVAGAAAAGGERNLVLMTIAAIPVMLWTYAVAVGTCSFMLSYATSFIDWTENPIPYLIWGTTVAIAPWAFMAQKDAQADNNAWAAMMTAFFLNIACLVAAVWYYLEPFEGWWEWAVKIGSVMCVSFVLQVVMILIEGSRRY